MWSVSNAKVVKFEDRDRTGDDMDFIARKTGTANISCRIRGTDVKKTCKVKVIKGKVKARIAVDDRTMDVEKKATGRTLRQGSWEETTKTENLRTKFLIKNYPRETGKGIWKAF